MAVLRRVALGLLVMASAAVLVLAALELWNYGQASVPASRPPLNPSDQARALQDRVDLLSKRVGDMEVLAIVLLATSGLYAIVFVSSSYLSANTFSRSAGQTIQQIQDQAGLAMGELRELQERTQQSLKDMLANPVAPGPANAHQQAADLLARVRERHSQTHTEQAKLELLRDENSAAHLEATAGPELGDPLAAIYLAFARHYAQADRARSQFHLERALRLAPASSPLASEIHFELACGWAAAREFNRAMAELRAAFEHQFLAVEERLANEIEEGGKLYELASTPPFDKAVNDLLLNMNIGIG